MFSQLDSIPSRSLGRRVHLWRFGRMGAPLLVLPSASGMAHEWQAHGMIDALEYLIETGRLKLYCSESNVAEAWTRKEGHPARRIQRHLAFESYVVRELVPLIREDCRSPEIPLAVAGSSLGALFAANFALKFPEIFRYALCLSGRYDATWLTDGFQNEDVYLNNPIAFVPGLQGEPLARIRRYTHLALVCGQGRWEDGNVEETRRLADLLDAKRISHECDLWGHDVAHEWVWWKRQARFHLEKTLAG